MKRMKKWLGGFLVCLSIFVGSLGMTACNDSKGLKYTLLANDSFEVSGIGDCTDTKIVIPRKYAEKLVTSIGDKAFYHCDSLTSVRISDGVRSIGDAAFSGCENLTSVRISDGVRSIGTAAFSGCKNLKNVTMGDGVSFIGTSAFDNCKSLMSIRIPNRVTYICDSAFLNCDSLTSITIPDSVTFIGTNAFAGCDGLTSITFNGTKVQWRAIWKEWHWNDNISVKKVVCSDGEVEI